MLEREDNLMSCSLSYAFYAIGGKWKPFIIWYLNCAPNYTLRYGELKRSIPWKISHKMFAQHLKELEQDGLILRREYHDERVMRVEYSLTNKGKFIVPIILYMRDWGIIFGENYPINSLVRTKGNWDGSTIRYECTLDGRKKMRVVINFDVGFEKEEISKKVKMDETQSKGKRLKQNPYIYI